MDTPLDAWIGFSATDGERPSLPAIHNCTINGTTANCTSVCGHIHLLFDPFATNNLVSCGIWQTASAAIHFEVLPNNTENTAPFEDRGLSMVYNHPYNSSTTADMIAECFGFTCSYKSNEGYAACSACDFDALFGSGAIDGALQNCMDMICSPQGSLNPDLGGVGMFASFIVQSSIAIVGSVALLSLTLWRKRNERRRKGSLNQHYRHRSSKGRTPEDHTEILVTAVVEFQKSQCYFAGTIQIAAIAFIRQYPDNGSLYSFLPAKGLPFVICTNGSIPVIFTLTFISFYGRPSWYLTLLTLCCFTLSTITFMYTNSLYSMLSEGEEAAMLSYPCGGWTPRQLSSWCGSGFSMPTIIDRRIAVSGWNDVLWMNSLLWALYCVIKQSLAVGGPQNSASHSFISRFASGWRSSMVFCDRWIKVGLGEEGKDCVFWVLFFTSWSMALGYQFYAYSLFFALSQIDPSWSFGQIVAIMVWIPAIAEYIYLLIYGIQEGSEYRLMAPLTVTAQQPTSAANADPVQPQQQPGNVSHTSSAEHGHSGRQGNESAMLPTTWSTSNLEIDIHTVWDDIQRVGQD